MLARYLAVPLWLRILLALGLGLGVGLLWGPGAAVLKPLGDIFLNAIRMLVVPLVFTSIVAGVCALGSPGAMGRIAGRMALIYVALMSVAVVAGMVWATVFQPGVGVALAGLSAPADRPTPDFVATVVSIVPYNIVKAMAEMDVLSVILFAILVGLGILAAGAPAEPLKRVMVAGQEVMFRITGWVMELAPIGVFALIAVVVGNNGPAVLLPLAKLIGTLYAAGTVHAVLMTALFVGVLARLPVARWVGRVADALVTAFSTSSSNATLPVAMRVMEQKVGVEKRVTGFVMPMGASLSMDGTVMYFGIVAVFAAQAVGVDLSAADYAVIAVTAVLAAMGASGIPSASLVLMPVVLASVGLPVEVVALIAGVDRVLDMMRTSLNVLADLMVATLIGVREGALDRGVFNGGGWPRPSRRDATPRRRSATP